MSTTPGYPSYQQSNSSSDDDDDDDDYYLESEKDDGAAATLTSFQRRETRMADRLSVRLLAVADDDEEEQERILRQSLQSAVRDDQIMASIRGRRSSRASLLDGLEGEEGEEVEEMLLVETPKTARRRIWTMIGMAAAGVAAVTLSLWLGIQVVGPPNQPVGPYQLVERQEGEEFFNYYTFYEGRDSVGSAGYNMYVSKETAYMLNIVNVSMELDELDVYNTQKRQRRQRRLEDEKAESSATVATEEGLSSKEETPAATEKEPFIYMGSSATTKGPRNSIRLEGIRRFDRGLFIIDLRHMPAGCGVWPAFWLTDEANWPLNGEIDIVEGVNYQDVAKTALHATDGCSMNDIPLGVMTGEWDTAQGIPDAKTGIPDMTLRYARNCFVYDPHQWINQGCVAVDKIGGTLGQPLNEKGGGVYVLEWDPMNRHIRTWVFTPHTSVPDNLVQAIRTAKRLDGERMAPDPDMWPIPYGYFAIGSGTDCPASHFRHMRIVFNMAFCGSVSGNRYQMDCKKQAKQFDTCNAWIQSEPDELSEAYWKIRGVYVYEREFERAWIN